jgi:hypothetical protein
MRRWRRTRAVIGKTAERHTSDEFVAFLEQIVSTQRRDREIHIIADNLSAHKTAVRWGMSIPVGASR